jgi:hypothetical protein
MDIKNGLYATLDNNSVYEITNYRQAIKSNKYNLRSTNPDDLNHGFKKYNDEVLIKTVDKSEIKKIESIHPYATLKNDSDKNHFEILKKKGVPEDMITLATANPELYEAAEKFGFGPCGYDSGTLEKTVSKDDIGINYYNEVLFATKKNYNRSDIKAALNSFGKKKIILKKDSTHNKQDALSFSC